MRLTIAAGALALALNGSAMAAQIYKWVDAEGITHFGAQPPSGQVAEAVNTSSSAPRAPAAAALPTQPEADADEQAIIDRQVKRQVAEQEAEVRAYCAQLRTSLAQLNNNPRLRVEEDGESRRLDENERQARIAETQKRIAEDC